MWKFCNWLFGWEYICYTKCYGHGVRSDFSHICRIKKAPTGQLYIEKPYTGKITFLPEGGTGDKPVEGGFLEPLTVNAKIILKNGYETGVNNER